MDKSTQKILILGGLGLAAWYILSKNKSSETPAKTTTGSGTGAAPVQSGRISSEAEKVLEELRKRNSGVASPRRPPMITDKLSPDKLSADEIKRIKNEIQRQKPPLGKYKLTGNVSHSVKRDNGLQQVNYPSKLYQFRAGDVVNAKEARFTDSEMTWYLLVEVGGQDRPFPLNLVSKVDDSTPVTSPKVTEEKNDGTIPMFYFAGKRPLTIDNLLM